jgi:hypothetical protein
VTGSITIAVDVDVRPDANGLLTLECLEMCRGERLPYTVEVVTGRGNGSRHLYFSLPLNATIRTRAKAAAPARNRKRRLGGRKLAG